MQEAFKVRLLPKCNLGYLLHDLCGIRTDKAHATADWRQRPLSPELLRYSVVDALCLQCVASALLDLLASGIAAPADGVKETSSRSSAATAAWQGTGSLPRGNHAAQSARSATSDAVNEGCKDADGHVDGRLPAGDAGADAARLDSQQGSESVGGTPEEAQLAWNRSQKATARVHKQRANPRKCVRGNATVSMLQAAVRCGTLRADKLRRASRSQRGAASPSGDGDPLRHHTRPRQQARQEARLRRRRRRCGGRAVLVARS
jgi:3'-5' exonuclease